MIHVVLIKTLMVLFTISVGLHLLTHIEESDTDIFATVYCLRQRILDTGRILFSGIQSTSFSDGCISL